MFTLEFYSLCPLSPHLNKSFKSTGNFLIGIQCCINGASEVGTGENLRNWVIYLKQKHILPITFCWGLLTTYSPRRQVRELSWPSAYPKHEDPWKSDICNLSSGVAETGFSELPRQPSQGSSRFSETLPPKVESIRWRNLIWPLVSASMHMGTGICTCTHTNLKGCETKKWAHPLKAFQEIPNS